MPGSLQVSWLDQIQHMLLGDRVRQHSPKQRLLDPDSEATHPTAPRSRRQMLISKLVHQQHATPSDLNQIADRRPRVGRTIYAMAIAECERLKLALAPQLEKADLSGRGP